jgi:hypothetical protein
MASVYSAVPCFIIYGLSQINFTSRFYSDSYTRYMSLFFHELPYEDTKKEGRGENELHGIIMRIIPT